MQRFKNALPSMPSMPSMPAFGSSNTVYSHTEPPISPDRTELIAARRNALDGILAALTSHHKTLSKVRNDPTGSTGDKTSQLPVLWVGELMANVSSELGRVRQADADTQDFARSLRALGEGHLAMGRAAADLNDALAMRVLDELEQLQKTYREYDKAYKEADKARSTLEARLAALDKGGKEDGSERRAEIEYDVARESVQTLADSVESGFSAEQRVLDELLQAETKHAEQHLTALQSCKGAFSGTGSGSRTPSRSSPSAKLAVPPRFSTRMARSHSDSVVRRPDLGSMDRETSSARRSTISDAAAAAEQPSPDKKTRPDALKSRSRSGSMLGRFTLRGKKKNKADKAEEGEDEESDDLDAYKHEESDVTSEPEGSRSSTPSRTSSGSPVGSRRGTGLPTLSSLKNMSLGASNGSSTGYGSLAEESYSSRATNTSSSPLVNNVIHRAPTFKRTQTAPSPSAFTRGTRYVEARWAFPTTASDELSLEKGDVVRVEREINADWWRGTIKSVQLASGHSRIGQEGMFPSAYCVPTEAGAEDELDFGRIKSRDTAYSNLSTEPDTATEDESETEAREEKVGLFEAGEASGKTTPRKMPPPPPRRRTGESSPFAG